MQGFSSGNLGGKSSRRRYRDKNTAIALKYDEENDVAPVIVATGNGYIAEKIIDTAEKHGIPVHKDESTAVLLSQLELGSRIPEEMFQIIAIIYAHIMDVAGKKKNQKNEVV
jgi:flagellar biosynthesis protein